MRGREKEEVERRILSTKCKGEKGKREDSDERKREGEKEKKKKELVGKRRVARRW